MWMVAAAYLLWRGSTRESPTCTNLQTTDSGPGNRTVTIARRSSFHIPGLNLDPKASLHSM